MQTVIPQEHWMQRCIDLARKGAGLVAPNPMVGSVLVYENRILGEGYHQQYGEPHAEVNCINSVAENDHHLIHRSTLYVSLEPCAHFGKTPPCTDLILSKNIPRVVIGCRDPFEQVNGKGVELLRKAGIEVTEGVLEAACLELNKRFFCFHQQHRPYIILKWAQSGNGIIGHVSHERLLISGPTTNRLVHKWRSEEAGILVGTNTALNDNPSLTNRYWTGKSPLRMVIDKQNRIPSTHSIFSPDASTIVFNSNKEEENEHIRFIRVTDDEVYLQRLLHSMYQLQVQSIIVEGGGKLLQSFIDQEYWDEARVITNRTLFVNSGVRAPVLTNASISNTEQLEQDEIVYYTSINSKKNIF